MDGMTTADEELFEAVSSDKPNEVRNLLRRTADIATKNKDGDTVLHLAASEGQENVVQELIRADKWKEIVNIKDASGQTALHNCCISGHTETIKLLLQNGADATATDQGGWTALHYAADDGYLEVARCLAKHMKKQKLDLNQKTNKTGSTALHIAANRGFAGIVGELMHNGASNTATAWDGETVLHWTLQGAIWVGHDLKSEDKAGDEGKSTNLNDERLNFDDGRSVRFDGLYQEEEAHDKPDQFDAVFKRIMVVMDDTTKWSELLKVARREERMEALQYLMSKMYARKDVERLQRPLRRIWLAMSEARTQELMEMLWAEACEARTPELMERLREKARDARTKELMERLRTEVREATTPEPMERLRNEAHDNTESMEKWNSMEKWDILSLATSLGKFQTVYWLLRSRRWSKSDINKAKNLPDYYRWNEYAILSTDDKIWNTPFVHDERSGGESYRWPADDPDRTKFDRFGATIMDFHKVDNQIVSIYYDCETSSLIHRGKDHGPSEIVGKSMGSLGDQDNGGMVTNEYSKESRCYRWINLAINSVPWMKDLAMISYLEKKAKREEWMATWQFLRRSWQELPENRDEESYMHPNCLRANLSQPKLKPGEQSTEPKHDESMRIALYMPYLTFGPFENTPHDESLAEEHEGGILHRSRTLDQFYHNVQDDKRARDRDQVFTRYIDRKEKGESYRRKSNDTEFNILRVNQLWLWVVDESTVISSTTHGLDNTEDPVFQGFLKRLFQSQTMFNREATPSSVDSFVKLIASFHINALDNLKVSLKVSSEQHKRKTPDGPSDVDRALGQNSTIDAAKTYTASLTTVFADSIEYNNKRERDLRKDFRRIMDDKTSRSGDPHGSILRALDILDDIKDIRDELNIINSVVQEQKTVWSQLFNQSRGSSTRDDASKEGFESSQWSNTDPDYVLKRVKDLLREAEQTEHNITSVLELEMNQLNVSEAEEARRQGGTLMAFTIITAIFLPLSFLASLFALNVSTFPHSGNDVQYQPGWIFGIMFGATLAFVLCLLLTVFREVFFGMIANVFKKFQELSQKESQPTEEKQDESKPTTEETGHETFRKRWQELSGRWRKEKPGGESV